MTQTQEFAQLEATIDIDASPAQVWALVTDVKRMAEWSPQVVRTIVRGGPVQLGTRALNINRRGPVVWPTRTKVVAFEPHREFAFRVKENKAIWSFTLEPTESGTRVIQQRRAPDGLSDISLRLTKIALGGQEAFTGELRAGMRQTLSRVKAESEA